jgi:predicted TIM-barrel fold metal-dependent hydrolase
MAGTLKLMSVSRRVFLAATAATGLAAPNLGVAADRPVLVDTHVHCFAGADPRFPYHPRGPYQPEETSTVEQLLKAMDDGGIDRAIIVHPEPYQDDHRYLEHCLTVGRGRLKGTVLFFVDQPGSIEQLPATVAKLPGGVVALRVHAYAPERLPPFDRQSLRKLWRAAAEAGIMIQLHVEARWAAPFTPEEFNVVVGWSRFPQTVMKISSLQPRTVFPHRDILPYLRQLTDAYGPDRLISGGGFGPGATGASYAAAFQKTRSYLSHLSDADMAKVQGLNAMKLFGFA